MRELTNGDWVPFATFIVLTFTLAGVFWYAFEARRQADTTRRVAEASLRPVIEQYVYPPAPLADATLSVLYRNFGNGPAVNIEWSLDPPGEEVRKRVGMAVHDVERAVEFAMPSTPPKAVVACYLDASGNIWESRLHLILVDGCLDNGNSSHRSLQKR